MVKMEKVFLLVEVTNLFYLLYVFYRGLVAYVAALDIRVDSLLWIPVWILDLDIDCLALRDGHGLN